uniref:Longin domain-containing protein n=1 Tax=Oryza meridionalis TaxID=40149 RepID=A0A0E0CB09_9ORYZ
MARNPTRTVYIGNLDEKISGQDKPSSNGNNPVMPKLDPVPLPKQPQFVHHSDMPVLHTPADPMHYQLDPCIATEGSAMVWRLCFECCWPWSSEATNVVSVLLGTKEGNLPREEAMKMESPGVQPAAAGEEGGGGGGGGVFFCMAVTSRGRTDRLSYFQAEGDGDDAEEVARATAALCLDHAPEHHHWHHHTVVGRRTFAFLAGDDGRTYFAVADPTPGSAETVRFLQRVRDAFGGGGATRRRNQRDDAVDAVVWQFVRALRASAGRGTAALFPGDSRGGGDASSADGDKDDDEEDDRGGEAMPVAADGARRRTRRSWWRYSKVVIGVELVLFLVLFVVWMIVCKGFNCVQR